MRDYANMTRRQRWLMAIRPRTLPASVTPVLVGTAAAYRDGGFRLLPAAAALLGSLLLQIGVNLANDYFDFKRGYDTPDRLGPVRVTAGGIIAPETVRNAMILDLFAAATIGLYLVWVGGWPILAVGAASILAALAYSGGPYPLASHGLGDLFVFIFFGLVAVSGTYYVQSLTLTPLAITASVPVGLLITAIIVVNNLRDIPTDAKVGKRTLAVIVGEKGTRGEFVALVAASYVLAAVLWVMDDKNPALLLPFLSLPFALRTTNKVLHSRGAELNKALSSTALLSLLFGVLLSAGLVVSK